MGKAKVYFTKEITPEAMIKMYEAMGVELTGKGCGEASFRRSGESEFSASGVDEVCN